MSSFPITLHLYYTSARGNQQGCRCLGTFCLEVGAGRNSSHSPLFCRIRKAASVSWREGPPSANSIFTPTLLPPPLNPARIAAEPTCSPCPFRFIFLPAIWANQFWMLPPCPLLRCLFLMIPHLALFAAEPTPPPRSFRLLYLVPTLRTNIHRHPIVPLRRIVSVPACIAAKLLPRDVARWDKTFPTILTLQFFCHFYAPFIPILS